MWQLKFRPSRKELLSVIAEMGAQNNIYLDKLSTLKLELEDLEDLVATKIKALEIQRDDYHTRATEVVAKNLTLVAEITKLQNLIRK